MVNVENKDIIGAFTSNKEVKGIYSYGHQVWPERVMNLTDITSWTNMTSGLRKIANGEQIWHDLEGHTYYMDVFLHPEYGAGVMATGSYELVDSMSTKNRIYFDPAMTLPYETMGEYVWNDGVNVYVDRKGATHKRLTEGWFTPNPEDDEPDSWYGKIWVSDSTNGLVNGNLIWSDYNGQFYYDDYDFHLKYKGNHQWEEYTPDYVGRYWLGKTAYLNDLIITYSYNTNYDGSKREFNSYLSQDGSWTQCHFVNAFSKREIIVHPEDVWKGPDGYDYYSDGSGHYQYLGDYRFKPVSFGVSFHGRNIWKKGDGTMYLTENYKTYLIETINN